MRPTEHLKLLKYSESYKNFYNIYITLRMIPFNRKNIKIFSNIKIDNTPETAVVYFKILNQQFYGEESDYEVMQFPISITVFSNLSKKNQLFCLINEVHTLENLNYNISDEISENAPDGLKDVINEIDFSPYVELITSKIVSELVRYSNFRLYGINSYCDKKFQKFLANKEKDFQIKRTSAFRIIL